MSNNNFNHVNCLNLSRQPTVTLIEQQLTANCHLIEPWLQKHMTKLLPPLYCSVDLRNAGFKLAPVDTNLFPAGFNNLTSYDIFGCEQVIRMTLEKLGPGVNQIMLIPEDHTRNIYYFENLATLYQILVHAGYEVRVGSLSPDLDKPRLLQLPSGKGLLLEPITRTDQHLVIGEFIPQLILLNNDLSAGIPQILQSLTEQLIVPPLHSGWHARLKSTHFRYYQEIVDAFSQTIGIDPWLLSPLYQRCERVNFLVRDGEQYVMEHTKKLLTAINQKYQEYGIKEKPFVVVKADAGTYGMAVMTVQDPAQLANLNRKDRTRMANIKGSREVQQVIIQEGIHTSNTWGKENATAEPVVYLIGFHVVGGFYRVHANKGPNENLNAPGMQFHPLDFALTVDQATSDKNVCTPKAYACSVVSRLASLAAAKELAAH